MSDTAIKVEGLGKSYLVGHNINRKNETFRELIIRNTRDFMRKGRDMISGKPIVQGDEVEEFWALKDINFEIKQGDRVGIIGRNGAGKSTLLKVLSRITEPTTGRISINGRVASLLEVGTGFHPELTGRENIFLNGAILGMSRREIQRKFDEIVDFAEVEKFLDTPVKRYSSGMYVRLAFAVAAHLEPEILIVDEVLAVGDAQFQKKCLGKMEEVGKEGRTVLFVSHNMSAVRSLCQQALLLREGKVISEGFSNEVLDDYVKNDKTSSIAIDPKSETSELKVQRVSFNYDELEPGFNRPLRFDLDLDLGIRMRDLNINLGFFNSIGARLLTARCVINEIPSGNSKVVLVVEDHHLPPGQYSLLLAMAGVNQMLFRHENLLRFELSDVGLDEPLLVPFMANHRDTIGGFIVSKWSIHA